MAACWHSIWLVLKIFLLFCSYVVASMSLLMLGGVLDYKSHVRYDKNGVDFVYVCMRIVSAFLLLLSFPVLCVVICLSRLCTANSPLDIEE